ncbi:hypothetical protein EKH77_29840 [Streptomyces luteoverticillatus]|uniref:Uncharacterized protein n=1 Tax=Streptomyces luteoverticillatus TaxID=66425 RepID=A0A3Q9G0V4_STRLT|nr:hypothetical protein EKH77_29840 [Streptomyces luteoverticillatus]
MGRPAQAQRLHGRRRARRAPAGRRGPGNPPRTRRRRLNSAGRQPHHSDRESRGAGSAAHPRVGRPHGRIAFGDTPVRFPLTTAVVRCYADAKE